MNPLYQGNHKMTIFLTFHSIYISRKLVPPFGDTSDWTTAMLVTDIECNPIAGAEAILEFHNWYKYYHGYLAAVVCVFGIIANALNIIVLTRRNMVSNTVTWTGGSEG